MEQVCSMPFHIVTKQSDSTNISNDAMRSSLSPPYVNILYKRIFKSFAKLHLNQYRFMEIIQRFTNKPKFNQQNLKRYIYTVSTKTIACNIINSFCIV